MSRIQPLFGKNLQKKKRAILPDRNQPEPNPAGSIGIAYNQNEEGHAVIVHKKTIP